MNDKTGRAYPHGKSVAPLYTEAPDQQPGFRAKPWWLMVQEHAVEKEFAANDWALERLTRRERSAFLPLRLPIPAAHSSRY